MQYFANITNCIPSFPSYKFQTPRRGIKTDPRCDCSESFYSQKRSSHNGENVRNFDFGK